MGEILSRAIFKAISRIRGLIYGFIGFTGVFRWFQPRGYLHRTLR